MPLDCKCTNDGNSGIARVIGAVYGSGVEIANALTGELIAEASKQDVASNKMPETCASFTLDSTDSSRQMLSWLPATVAAVALRLFSLDAALAYRQDKPPAREHLKVAHHCLCLNEAAILEMNATMQEYQYVQRPYKFGESLSGQAVGKSVFDRLHGFCQG